MGLTQKLGTIPLAISTDTSNNVGIGGSPSGTYKLEVTGTAKVSGALTGASATFGGNLSITGNNFFTLATTNTSARIGEYDATNRICFTANQNSSDAQDDATKPSWGLVFNANATNTAFIGYKAAGGGSAALTSLMTITGAGNVGIGTNSPDSKLQVAGTCKIDSTLYSTSEIVLGSSGSYPVGGVGFRNDGINLNIYYGANNCIFKDVTNVERMRITSGGQVQIKQSANTFADGFRLISSNSIYWGLVVGGDNNLYLGYNSPSASIGVFNYATGIYTATSDINKKKDFEDSTIGLNAILGLKPKLFRMKSENNEVEKSLGFIAQEVKEFIPQAYVDSNNFIGLNDRPIIAALVKAIQEMNTKLDEQNQLITSLQDRLDKAGL